MLVALFQLLHNSYGFAHITPNRPANRNVGGLVMLPGTLTHASPAQAHLPPPVNKTGVCSYSLYIPTNFQQTKPSAACTASTLHATRWYY